MTDEPLHAEDDAWLEPKKVAALIGISRRTLREWVRKGLFPEPMRVNRKTIRWKRTTVLSWLADRQSKPKDD